MTEQKCGGCQRELKAGDLFIRDTPSGFAGKDANPEVDGLVAEILTGGSLSEDPAEWVSEVFFCEDCTEPGGSYTFEVVPVEWDYSDD